MSIEEIKQRRDFVDKEIQAVVNKQEYISDVSFLLEQNNQLREERDSFQRVGIKVQEVNVRLVEALEQFTRGKFHRSIVVDTWGPMEHIENEPWKIAEEAIRAYKLLEKKD